MQDAVRGLMNIIHLEALEDNLFRGQSVYTGQQSIFGGLVAGQALMAATQTVASERQAHSLHGYFLRAGDYTKPVIYEVERIRDGKTFTTRRVKAIQHGRAIFTMSASFQVAEEGFNHQATMPDVPPPEDVAVDTERRAAFAQKLPEKVRQAMLRPLPIEFRYIKPKQYDFSRQEPERLVWFRLADKVDIDAALQKVLLTFCSDFGLLTTAMIPHGLSYFQPNVQCASLDHAMWFHRDFCIDDWLLYATTSASAQGSKGMNSGHIYTRDGVLVASVAQEGLVRVHKESE